MKATRPSRNVRLLLGFLLKGEVDAIVKQTPFEIEGDTIRLWRESAEAARTLSGTPLVLDIPVLDEGSLKIIAEIKARQTYKKYYESLADYQFALVPIDSLLTPQWFADMDYIEELSNQIGPDRSMEEQIRFAMAEGSITEPIVAGSQVVFSSQRRDLHADQIPSVRQVDSGEFEIVIRASSRPNYIQAAALGGRLLLTNGVHKVCALFLSGYTHVPCVLRSIARVEESGINQQTSLLRPDLLGGPRPAQVIDFLDDRISVPAKLRSMCQVLRVGIGIETLDVPSVVQTTVATRRLNLDTSAPTTSTVLPKTAA